MAFPVSLKNLQILNFFGGSGHRLSVTCNNESNWYTDMLPLSPSPYLQSERQRLRTLSADNIKSDPKSELHAIWILGFKVFVLGATAHKSVFKWGPHEVSLTQNPSCLQCWKTASQMHVAPRIVIHRCSLLTICPRWCPIHAPDIPQMMPQLMPQTYLSVSYLISSKRLLFKNIAHDGSFQHCTWLYPAMP